MNVYRVGGSVRDLLLGRTPQDLDFVVTGATPEDLLEAGMIQVGASFPVFLDKDGNEWALARRERKVATGHKGFAFEFDPSVTIEEDLARRDFTINAIATSVVGDIIDPFLGLQDINDRILRAVSPQAFVEDPLRLLRLARFAAQLPAFEVEPGTIELGKAIADSGELASLTAERVYGEFKKAMLAPKPSRFFNTLWQTNSLRALFPEIADLIGVPENVLHHPEGWTFIHTMQVIDAARAQCIVQGLNEKRTFAVVVGALCHDLGKALTDRSKWPAHHEHEKLGLTPTRLLLSRIKAESYVTAFALKCVEHHMRVQNWDIMSPGKLYKLMSAFGVYNGRGENSFGDFLTVCEADKVGRSKPVDWQNLQARRQFFESAIRASADIHGRQFLRDDKEPGPWLTNTVDQFRILAIKKARINFNASIGG